MSKDGRKGALYVLLYADDLVLMAETIEELEAQFIRWKAAFEGKGLKINQGKTKVVESGCGSGSGVVVLAKIDPCSMCGKRVKVNCVRCNTCKKWVHAWCARVKRVSCKINGNFEYRVCEDTLMYKQIIAINSFKKLVLNLFPKSFTFLTFFNLPASCSTNLNLQCQPTIFTTRHV